MVEGPYTRTFFLEVFTDSVTIDIFFHASSTVFSVRINGFFPQRVRKFVLIFCGGTWQFVLILERSFRKG